jgi:hypothetical protein
MAKVSGHGLTAQVLLLLLLLLLLCLQLSKPRGSPKGAATAPQLCWRALLLLAELAS